MIFQHKLDEKTQLKWAEFKSDSEKVSPCTEFLKFLDLHESVSHTGHKPSDLTESCLLNNTSCYPWILHP